MSQSITGGELAQLKPEQPVCDGPPVKGKRKTRRGGTQRRKALKGIHVRRTELQEAEEEVLADLDDVREEKAVLEAREGELEEALAGLRAQLEALNNEWDHVKALSAAARQVRLERDEVKLKAEKNEKEEARKVREAAEAAQKAAQAAQPIPAVITRPTLPRFQPVLPLVPLPPIMRQAPPLRYDPQISGFSLCYPAAEVLNPNSIVPSVPSSAPRPSKAIPIIDPKTMLVKEIDLSATAPVPAAPKKAELSVASSTPAADPVPVVSGDTCPAYPVVAPQIAFEPVPVPAPASSIAALQVKPDEKQPQTSPVPLTTEPVEAGFVHVEPPTPEDWMAALPQDSPPTPKEDTAASVSNADIPVFKPSRPTLHRRCESLTGLATFDNDFRPAMSPLTNLKMPPPPPPSNTTPPVRKFRPSRIPRPILHAAPKPPQVNRDSMVSTASSLPMSPDMLPTLFLPMARSPPRRDSMTSTTSSSSSSSSVIIITSSSDPRRLALNQRVEGL
ncbi:MAG: hypothetical protein STHCBS139747_005111 [Sporothrix thermara]